ncbi:hypothetical protein LTS10_009592 [Elasticomyces elasticus]|nr:hypothetical protein LTS10_009592 [Elasticomyces elasticus]
MADQSMNGGMSNGGDASMKMETGPDTNMTDIQPINYPQPPQQPQQPLQPQPVQHLMERHSAQPARAASIPPPPPVRTQPVAHGGPTRQFLNQHITPHLLEGMKYVAMQEPDKPLLWLSEFLRDRSKEVEG